MREMITIIGIAGFWILSPESLVLAGNAAGHGVFFSIAVLVFYAVAVIVSVGVSRLAVQGMKPAISPGGRQGENWLSILSISGVLGAALCVSTGVLVTAGFTFNEVFYYRFPNFGFSFLLLGVILLLHLFGTDQSRHLVQGVLVLVGALFLTILVLTGMVKAGMESSQIEQTALPGSSPLSFLPLLLVFVGIEKISNWRKEITLDVKTIAIFLLMLTIIIAWVYVSGAFVDGSRLALSSIPYMNSASAIMGQTGRLLMGVIIIVGSLAVVICLLNFSKDDIKRVLSVPENSQLPRFASVLLIVFVGVMMGTGMAGTDRLERFIRASLLVWLGAYGISSLFKCYRSDSIAPLIKIIGIGTSGVVSVSGIALLLFHKEAGETALAVLFIILAGSFLTYLVQYWHDKAQKTKNHLSNKLEV